MNDLAAHDNLNLHIDSSTGLYMCYLSSCDFKLHNKSEIITHIDSHNIKRFLCPYCPRKCLYYKDYLNHMQSKKYHCLYKCGICDFSTDFLSEIQLHTQTHGENQMYWCPILSCPYHSKLESLVKNHIMSHFGIRKFNCHKCCYSSNSFSELKQHNEEHECNTRYEYF